MKKMILIGLTMAIAVGFSACVGVNKSKTPQLAYPVTVENMKIDNAPNSVASLSPAITQILIELGYGDKIVGYPSDYSGEGVSEQNQIGTGLELNLEKIGELAPEIIFTTVPLPSAQMNKLATVNVRVLVLPTVVSVDEIKKRYIDIATVMGGQFDGETIGAKHGAEIDMQLDAIEAALPKKQTFLYIATLDPTVAGEGTIQSTIASVLGENAAKAYAGYNVTAEQIGALTPDIVIYDNSIDPAAILAHEVFGQLNAVKSGAMFGVDGNEMTLSTNGFAKVCLKLANTVHNGVDFAPKAEEPSSDDVAS